MSAGIRGSGSSSHVATSVDGSNGAASADMSQMQSKAASLLGMSDAELQRRKEQARKPHVYVSDASQRAFAVRSTAHARQVLAHDLVSREHAQRQQALQLRSRQLRRFRVGFLIVSYMGVGVLAYLYIAPRLSLRLQHRRDMQLRQQHAYASLTTVTVPTTATTSSDSNSTSMS